MSIVIIQALFVFISGAFFTYRITLDLVSGENAGDKVKVTDENGNLTEKISQYHGQYDGERGPFDLYIWIRKIAGSENLRKYTEQGMGCRYCMSFWVGIANGVLAHIVLPDVFTLLLSFYVGLGYGAIVVFIFTMVEYKSFITAGIKYPASEL